MKSLNLRLKVLFFLTGVALIFSAFKGYQSYQQASYYSKQIQLSYKSLNAINTLKKNRKNAEAFSEIKAIQQKIEPFHREETLKDLLSSILAGSKRQTRENFKVYEINEANYRQYATKHLDYNDSNFKFTWGLSSFITLMLLITAFFVTENSIFKPLAKLQLTMTNFKHNKYSFEFEVPQQNELGHLHETFNTLAQQVLEQVEELKTLDQAKSDFLSIASHELRTPLTSIKGSLNLINAGVVGDINPDAKNLVSIAEIESDRLIRIINDLLDLAKIEAQKFPLKTEYSSLEDLIVNTTNSLHGLAATANVNLTYSPLPEVAVLMDSERTQQVLTNLISNAIKFSPEESTVNIEVSLTNRDEVLFEVKDQGPGIAPEDQEHIFEQFRQVDGSKTPIVKGTGLGLAISKGLVEQHGGRIGVKSQPGQGSCFYFYLPEYQWSKYLDQAA